MNADLIQLPLWYISFLFALTCHEAMHALAAKMLGDDTAYQDGILTLNPVPHVRREPVGMVVVPILSFLSAGYCIGWASAPYDPSWRIRFPRKAGLMALAGPFANLLIAVVAALILNILFGFGFAQFGFSDSSFLGLSSSIFFFSALVKFLQINCYLNILLFVFNLIPLPPFDGYGALGLVLPRKLDLKLYEFASNPNFQLAGLLLAWLSFGYLITPIWGFVVYLFQWTLIFY